MNAARTLLARIWHGLGYFSVLKPSFVFGLTILGLPVAALELKWLPSVFNFMFGNLFVEYTFGDGFWVGFSLFGAVWAVMLTACLTLDLERDRPCPWIPDPGANRRCVTIPMPGSWRGAYRFWNDRAEAPVTAFNALNDRHKEHPLGDTIGSRVMG